MQKQFGDILKELRLEKNLTQDELSKKFNTGKSTISHYEINRRLPDANTIYMYAEYFGVSLDYIMGKTDVRNIEEKTEHFNFENVPKKENMFFADRLRYLMVMKDLTAESVSKRLGIDKSEFIEYAKGIHFPTAEILKKIALIFDESLDYLLGVVDSPEKNKAISNDDDFNLILPDYIEVVKIAQNKKIPAKVIHDFIKLYLNRDK